LPSNTFRLVTSAATAFAPIPESTLLAADLPEFFLPHKPLAARFKSVI
jgi:hypothetical protein